VRLVFGFAGARFATGGGLWSAMVIPAGNYQVILQMSGKFGFIVPCVLAVPGFTDIEIHIGNQPSDTEGCCLVGQTHSSDWVGNSAAAFEALMLRLQDTPDNISITYIGGTQAA
jgi:hypothetical protein